MENNEKLDWQYFDNVLKMLESSDKDNTEVVLTIIENIDIEKNLPFILLLFKESSRQQKYAIFKSKIPKLKTYIPDVNHVFTYYEIFKQLSDDQNTEAVDYFMSRMANHIEYQLDDWGLHFREKYKIKFERKQ